MSILSGRGMLQRYVVLNQHMTDSFMAWHGSWRNNAVFFQAKTSASSDSCCTSNLNSRPGDSLENINPKPK